MPDTFAQSLHDWQNFYLLAGGAAATLVGLTFVAISIGSGLLTKPAVPTLWAYVSPAVIRLTYVLFTAIVVMVPTMTRGMLGTLLVIAGVIGLAGGLGLLPMMGRWRGRAWYVLIPSLGYLLYAAGGVGLLLGIEKALDGLALAIVLLLLAGIWNAWDTLVFIAAEQRESPTVAEKSRPVTPEVRAETAARVNGPRTLEPEVSLADRHADVMVQAAKGIDDRPASLALLPAQQADVLRVIQEAGLNPGDFTWAVQPSRRALIGPLISALVHTSTGYFFRFESVEDASGQKRISVFSGGEDAPEVTKVAGSWEDQLGHVRTWLKYLQPQRE